MGLHADDRAWIESATTGTPGGISAFVERFLDRLRTAHQTMRTAAAGCRLSLDDLQEHFVPIVAREYLDGVGSTDSGLEEFLERIHLDDLMLATACRQQDAGAWTCLQGVIQQRVGPRLHKNWVASVSPRSIDEVVAELPSHCFMAPSRGEQTASMRLSAYRGRSSLRGWLYAVAHNLLRERVRARHRAPQPLPDLGEPDRTSSGAEPSEQSDMGELSRRGLNYSQKLTQTLHQTLQSMPQRRRLAAGLHWVEGLRSSEVADLMEVSRPRVSQMLGEAERDLRAACRQICEEIAAESGRSTAEIENILSEQLVEFFRNPIDRDPG